MKFIDDDGKLFGKVNIIDFVIVFSICVMVFLAFKYFYLLPEREIYVQMRLCAPNPALDPNVFGVSCGSVPLYFVEAIKQGDKIIWNDDAEGEVTKVDSRPKTRREGDIIVEVKLKVKEKDDTYEYHAQEVKIGYDLKLNTFKTNLIGMVLNIGLNETEIKRDLKVQDITMEVYNVPLEVMNELEIGDVERDLTERIVAKIVDFETRPASGTNVHIKIKAKILTEREGNDYWFKDAKIRIGAPILIETEKIYLNGNIIELGFEEDEKEIKTKQMAIEVKWQNQRPWIADSILIGSKEKRTDGTVLAEIIDKKTEPAVMVVTTEDGNVFLRQNPYNKDITLKIRILAELKGSQWLFHSNEIKTGIDVFIKTDDINIGGEITKVIT